MPRKPSPYSSLVVSTPRWSIGNDQICSPPRAEPATPKEELLDSYTSTNIREALGQRAALPSSPLPDRNGRAGPEEKHAHTHTDTPDRTGRTGRAGSPSSPLHPSPGPGRAGRSGRSGRTGPGRSGRTGLSGRSGRTGPGRAGPSRTDPAGPGRPGKERRTGRPGTDRNGPGRTGPDGPATSFLLQNTHHIS